jgi:2-amino-4-hydroxy-6-hydroxymethyldihydropteridine diphosphokinase
MLVAPMSPERVHLAAVALGSNLGDRRAHLGAALKALDELPGTRVSARSTFLETEPVGPPGQGKYLNAAAMLRTTMAPRPLLEALLGIERGRGRERRAGERWGARTLDLDLLLYDESVIAEPGLSVPHPRLHERLFVLRPLAEIAPDVRVPPAGARVRELLELLERGAQA